MEIGLKKVAYFLEQIHLDLVNMKFHDKKYDEEKGPGEEGQTKEPLIPEETK